MSQPYPKIESLYTRDEDHFVTDEIRCPEFNLIRHWLVTEKIDGTNIRVCLEPFPILEEVAHFDDFGITRHLTQTGVSWNVRFHGRTDKAQIPPRLQAYLEKTFTLDKMRRLWRGKNDCKACRGSGRIHTDDNAYVGWVQCDCVEPYSITLYGEGYGGRIQKGGNYRPDESFRLFDVVVDDKYWLEWKNVCDIANKLGIRTVPVYGMHNIDEIDEMVRVGFASTVSGEESSVPLEEDLPRAEGIVARTDPYLYNSRGRPLRFKLKTRDYAQKKEANNA